MNEDNSIKRKLSILDYTKTGIDAVSKTFYRFPLTIILFVLLAVVIIYRIETSYNENVYEVLDRLTAVLLLGITLSLTVQVLFERFLKKDNVITKISIYVLELLLLTVYYTYLFPNTNLVSIERLLLFSIALILSFLFIPYLFKKENFEIYITKIITRLIVSAFFTTVLALGLTATLFAIQSLLYNDLRTEFYAYVWTLAWCIFAPIYFLHGLPRRSESFNLDSYHKIIQVLLLYIILPLLGVFTAVLYVYFGKILITQVWPEGIVSYLVLSYTSIGITSIFLISPLKDKNKWAKTFISLYTKLILPLLVIMFISIGIRIKEYGFTENRYFIVIIGIWATFAMAYIIFNKCKNNIVLPISLAIVAFLSVWGPWSAFNISIASQSERFYNILSKYEMIQNNEVVSNNIIIEDADQREIVGILRYFERSHELNDLVYLPADFRLDKMEDTFGFTENIWYNDPYNHFNYYKTENNPLVISGYDIHFSYRSYEFNNDKVEKEFVYDYGNFKINISKEYIMTLSSDSNVIYQVNLLDYIKTLNDKYGTNNSKDGGASTEDLILIDKNDEVRVMFVYNQIYGTVNNTSDDKILIDNIEADMYIDIK